jgi:hypothetical protein
MATTDPSSITSTPISVSLPRDEMIAIIEGQPADSSYDELLRELIAARAVERGLADVDAGRTVSHEDAAARVRSWRK